MKIETKPKHGQVVIMGMSLQRRGCGSSPDKCGVSEIKPFRATKCYLESNPVEPYYAVKPSGSGTGTLQKVNFPGTIYCAFNRNSLKRVYSSELETS